MPLVRKSGGAPVDAAAGAVDLAQSLASADEELRWAAVRAATAAPASALLLGNALRTETSARVRQAMFTSLSGMGEAGAGALLPLLRGDDADMRTGALDALRILVRSSGDLLPPLLADPDVDVRILSCELARALPGEAATPLLCQLLLREEDANVCAAAVDVLAEVGQPDALPALAACAARFPASPFLAFAIQTASDRISAQVAGDRG